MHSYYVLWNWETAKISVAKNSLFRTTSSSEMKWSQTLSPLVCITDLWCRLYILHSIIESIPCRCTIPSSCACPHVEAFFRRDAEPQLLRMLRPVPCMVASCQWCVCWCEWETNLKCFVPKRYIMQSNGLSCTNAFVYFCSLAVFHGLTLHEINQNFKSSLWYYR